MGSSGRGTLVLVEERRALVLLRLRAALTRLDLNGNIARTGEGWSLTRPRR